ncbi:MAG: hypothetical protein AAF770_03745, partial [Bacteroidota bacterium]
VSKKITSSKKELQEREAELKKKKLEEKRLKKEKELQEREAELKKSLEEEQLKKEKELQDKQKREAELKKKKLEEEKRKKKENERDLDKNEAEEEQAVLTGEVGFENQGNTCFLNTALQPLVRIIPPLIPGGIKGVVSWYQRVEDAKAEFPNTLYTNEEKVVQRFSQLVGAMEREGKKKKPKSISKEIKEFRVSLGKINPDFNSGCQEDSILALTTTLEAIARYFVSEYADPWTSIDKFPDTTISIDKLQEEINAIRKKVYNKGSFVDQLFDSTVIVSELCRKRGFEHIQLKRQREWKLPVIDKKNNQPIYQLKNSIQKFQEETKLHKSQYFFICDKKENKQSESVLRQEQVITPPNMMIIHLDIFKTYENQVKLSGDKTSLVADGNNKYTHKISYPLSGLEVAGERYDLKAVMVHLGATSGSGHYIGFVKKGPDQWLKLDDSNVTTVSDHFVQNIHDQNFGTLSSPTPIGFFYQKKSFVSLQQEKKKSLRLSLEKHSLRRLPFNQSGDWASEDQDIKDLWNESFSEIFKRENFHFEYYLLSLHEYVENLCNKVKDQDQNIFSSEDKLKTIENLRKILEQSAKENQPTNSLINIILEEKEILQEMIDYHDYLIYIGVNPIKVYNQANKNGSLEALRSNLTKKDNQNRQGFLNQLMRIEALQNKYSVREERLATTLIKHQITVSTIVGIELKTKEALLSAFIKEEENILKQLTSALSLLTKKQAKKDKKALLDMIRKQIQKKVREKSQKKDQVKKLVQEMADYQRLLRKSIEAFIEEYLKQSKEERLLRTKIEEYEAVLNQQKELLLAKDEIKITSDVQKQVMEIVLQDALKQLKDLILDELKKESPDKKNIEDSLQNNDKNVIILNSYQAIQTAITDIGFLSKKKDRRFLEGVLDVIDCGLVQVGYRGTSIDVSN